MPKINSLKTDILKRNVDLAFLQEIWEQSENEYHIHEIETMLEIDGLIYISNPRKPNRNNVSHGGTAVIINSFKFTGKKLDISVPSSLEVVWCLVKPKQSSAKFKEIVACSFYSPPDKNKNTQLADYLVSSLHLVSSKYPESAILLGADRNGMDISPILNCGLKLRQMVECKTHGRKIFDIIIMNMGKYHNSAIIAPPIQSDNPLNGKHSHHNVTICNLYI